MPLPNRGRCVNNEHHEASFQQFRDKRSEIYALFDRQEGLESGVRKEITRYVDDFYELIDDPRAVERRIVDKCK
jgi:hypothetical protein